MKRLLAMLALMVVTGCGVVSSGAAPGLGQAEVASVMVSKKTITDHVVSYMSGKNCTFMRSNQGLTYCEEDEKFPKPPVYCYKTLGQVTCYDRPDPFDPRTQKLGENDHNLPNSR
ncbi:MAG: hypothetical protein H7841_07490 [Magnetospirillum sp. WYHS-4]